MESVSTADGSAIEPKGKLLRILGVSFGVAVTLGSTIGVGILRTPGAVAAQLGDFWLIIGMWIAGGIYALFGTIAVIELATSLPQAGGWYVYARRAFGEYAGFTIGWINWISYCTATASITLTIGEYGSKLAPALAGHATTIAITTLLVFCLMHWLGLRTGSFAQELISFATAIGFVALVVACFAFGKSASAGFDLTEAQAASQVSLALALVLSFQAVIFTYDGWYGAIYFSEEDKDPARNLPRSMITGALVIIAIYLLINVTLLYVLPIPVMAASQLAAADAAQAVFGTRGGQIITVLSFISLISVTNACFLQTPRIMYGMSRDGLFLSGAAAVNRKGTPTPALLISTATVVVMVASGTFERLLAITAFFWVLMYGSGFLSLFVLRKKAPELARPFKAWGYPWTTLTVVVLSLVFLVGVMVSDTENSLYALAMLAISYPIYLIYRKSLR